jgi:hypothetical protein
MCLCYSSQADVCAGLLLQAQGVGGRPVKYSGMLDVFAKTYHKEGVVGFYKVGGTDSGQCIC